MSKLLSKRAVIEIVPLFIGIADSMCWKTDKECEHWRLEYALMTTGGQNTTRGKLYFSPGTGRRVPIA